MKETPGARVIKTEKYGIINILSMRRRDRNVIMTLFERVGASARRCIRERSK